MSLIEDIKFEEGFKGEPYICTEGFLTVGYGTKFPLDEKECSMLLEYRLSKMQNELDSSLYYLQIDKDAWDILYNMAYQMGVSGVLKFKNMIKALEEQDYRQAAIEMLDSKWAKQTPNRAYRLSARMEGIK